VCVCVCTGMRQTNRRMRAGVCVLVCVSVCAFSLSESGARDTHTPCSASTSTPIGSAIWCASASCWATRTRDTPSEAAAS
jgi:hypothetical protein